MFVFPYLSKISAPLGEICGVVEMSMSLEKLRTFNQNRTLHRGEILAFLGTNPPVPTDVEIALQLGPLATCAAGYQEPVMTTDDRKRFLRLAVGCAETVQKLNPDAAAGHYWFAVSRALELNLLGFFATIFGIGKVRQAAQRAVALDERENAGGPLRIRAMLSFRLPFFLGGNKQKALADLERSNALFPNFRENILFLAEVQEKLQGANAAIATLERGLATAPSAEPELEARWQLAMEERIKKLHMPA